MFIWNDNSCKHICLCLNILIHVYVDGCVELGVDWLMKVWRNMYSSVLLRERKLISLQNDIQDLYQITHMITLAICVSLFSAYIYAEMCFEVDDCNDESCHSDFFVECVYGECTCTHRKWFTSGSEHRRRMWVDYMC